MALVGEKLIRSFLRLGGLGNIGERWQRCECDEGRADENGDLGVLTDVHVCYFEGIMLEFAFSLNGFVFHER